MPDAADEAAARPPGRTRSSESAQRYRARETLTYPADPALVRQRLAGKNVPVHEWKKVAPGQLLPEDFPAPSIPWLLRQGRIEPA